MSIGLACRTFLAGAAAAAPCILHAAEPGRMAFITPQGYRLAFAQAFYGVIGLLRRVLIPWHATAAAPSL